MPVRGNSQGVPSASQGSGYSTWQPCPGCSARTCRTRSGCRSRRRQAERGHRVEEAGRQAPQAAVAERASGSQSTTFPASARAAARLRGTVGQAQRGQRVGQRAPDQNSIEGRDAACLRPARAAACPPSAANCSRDLRDRLHQLGGRGLAGATPTVSSRVGVDGGDQEEGEFLSTGIRFIRRRSWRRGLAAGGSVHAARGRQPTGGSPSSPCGLLRPPGYACFRRGDSGSMRRPGREPQQCSCNGRLGLR